jgi:hypothetical protein
LDHYKNAPQLLQDKIEALLARLEVTISNEVETSFITILANHPSLHIYSLGLYYGSEGWDYIAPTFASEEGLEYVATERALNANDNIETNKIALRWSLCDSPHHDDDQLAHLMPMTEEILQTLSFTLDDADPLYKQYEWDKVYEGDYKLFYEFLSQVYELIKNTVISSMNSLWENRRWRDYFILNGCALTLNTEDISEYKLLEHIKKLNTGTMYKKIAKEIELSRNT